MSCTTWVAPVVALVGTLINAQKCKFNLSNGAPDAALEVALDGGLNVALEDEA